MGRNKCTTERAHQQLSSDCVEKMISIFEAQTTWPRMINNRSVEGRKAITLLPKESCFRSCWEGRILCHKCKKETIQDHSMNTFRCSAPRSQKRETWQHFGSSFLNRINKPTTRQKKNNDKEYTSLLSITTFGATVSRWPKMLEIGTKRFKNGQTNTLISSFPSRMQGPMADPS